MMVKRNRQMALIMTLAVLLTMAGTCMVGQAEVENILENPGFETAADGSPGNWVLVTGSSIPTLVTDSAAAQEGSNYLSLPGNDATVYTSQFALEANTNYTLSFWTRSSVNNSGYIDLRYYVDGIRYNEYCNNNQKPFIFGEHMYTAYFGTEKAAPAAGEEDNRLEWDQVSYNFTTPPLANSAVLSLANEATSGDLYLCVDNLSMAATGDVPNLIRNGRLAALKGGVPTNWEIGSSDGSKPWELLIDETGTPYIKTGPDGKPVALYTNVRPHQGRYKLSFDYKNDDSVGYAPSVYMKECGAWRYLERVGYKGVWQTYEMYFDISDQNGLIISDFRISLGYGTGYVKNIVLQRDESGIDFCSEIVFGVNQNFKSDNRHTAVSAIKDVTPADGAYPVIARAHYVPQTTGNETFTMLTCIYKYQNGEKLLYAISKKNSDTVTGGLLYNMTDAVSVPSASDGVTYKVEAFIWNDIEALQPLCGKSTLEY